jgi:hypothetical protein
VSAGFGIEALSQFEGSRGWGIEDAMKSAKPVGGVVLKASPVLCSLEG